MDDFDLDALLDEYEEGKQEETRERVRRALELEKDRTEGVRCLKKFVLDAVRHSVARFQQAGHTVACHEFLDHYPPEVRIDLWPKPGPLETEEPGRVTLEFVWGEPEGRKLCARRWSRSGLASVVVQAAAAPAELDELWAREQIVAFARAVLFEED